MDYYTRLERAQLLMQQNRLQLAEETLQAAIAEEPNLGIGYAVMALINIEHEKFDESQALAERAIGLAPDDSYCHYVKSIVLLERGYPKDAHEAVDDAIRMTPEDPDYHAQKARIFGSESQWQAAIDCSETGLQFDPEHLACNNLRSMSLTRLGRTEEASVSLRETLSSNPDSSYAHANSGWNELNGGDPLKAAEHFKESLRLDPANEYARLGIIESMKARSWLYRSVLNYLFWINRLPPRTQMLAFVGVIILLQVLIRLPVGSVLGITGLILGLAYMVFVATVWLANPIFNLFLRFDRFGRNVLNAEEKADTNYIALAGGLCAVLCSMPIVTAFRQLDVISYSLLMLSVAVCLSVPREAKRKQAAIATIIIWACAFYYWYGWYFGEFSATLLSLDVNNLENMIKSDEGVQFLERVEPFVKRQQNLKSLFTWGTVLMTWASFYFSSQNR